MGEIPKTELNRLADILAYDEELAAAEAVEAFIDADADAELDADYVVARAGEDARATWPVHTDSVTGESFASEGWLTIEMGEGDDYRIIETPIEPTWEAEEAAADYARRRADAARELRQMRADYRRSVL